MRFLSNRARLAARALTILITPEAFLSHSYALKATESSTISRELRAIRDCDSARECRDPETLRKRAFFFPRTTLATVDASLNTAIESAIPFAGTLFRGFHGPRTTLNSASPA